ncbi:MAG: Na+ dependent nucleoside transporter domain protein [Opitutae bacterium]|nr:Na+ dependent nucleoside transporter domain protein [Opitutae bacterium]MBT5692314.1 Na+ dependent nucleoside transporter domain protein [Opitutae bacterium]MBT6462914.1 Na+ dependent nucleoside transporter domain protein [Opitutae bacterium]MBT7855035.1 Na+ dependent nucleoside transporter domain protein [Opitutae bacterium]
MLKLISLTGLVAFIALAWAISIKRGRFPWRTVLTGLGLQVALAAILIPDTIIGRSLYTFADGVAKNIVAFASKGTQLVFGDNNSFVLGITICGTIILVAVLSSLLYHLGVLQLIVRGMAWIMRRIMRTSGSESLCCAANVFMGQTEAPLVIQPYLKGMTRSEIMTMMVGGMATIAGGVFAIYADMGFEAGHLLTASFMAAPTALYVSKILLPETEKSETVDGAKSEVKPETTNALDAMCQGAGDGMKLTLNVLAMLIGFTAAIAALNFLITQPQEWAKVADPVTIDRILGWLNAPFAWLMGIPWVDCNYIGECLGKRMVFTEFIGYEHLKDAISQNGKDPKVNLDPRSIGIASFAICGFANFASIAIQIGGIGSLAPERRKDLASLGLRAMAGGILVSYLNACVAGIFL